MLDNFPVDSGRTSKQENKRRENVTLTPIIIDKSFIFGVEPKPSPSCQPQVLDYTAL